MAALLALFCDSEAEWRGAPVGFDDISVYRSAVLPGLYLVLVCKTKWTEAPLTIVPECSSLYSRTSPLGTPRTVLEFGGDRI